MKMDQPIGDKATAAMLGLPACAGGAAGGLQATQGQGEPRRIEPGPLFSLLIGELAMLSRRPSG